MRIIAPFSEALHVLLVGAEIRRASRCAPNQASLRKQVVRRSRTSYVPLNGSASHFGLRLADRLCFLTRCFADRRPQTHCQTSVRQISSMYDMLVLLSDKS